jgi:FMN-dependent oxidoreductase (nitrilotriacetate monooxygenase family)
MPQPRRQLNLNLFIYPGGHHEAGWRYKASDPKRVLDVRYYQDLARQAEAAKLDAVFFADSPALADDIRYASRFRLEPITLLSAIAAVTNHIGLIATASTTYNEPYNLARQFAALDHISGGRAGWNIVTTSAAVAARNFGLDEHPPHADRYSRAEEFLEVVSGLWDGWHPDAVIADPASGIFADTAKVHAINHAGRHFRVAGPLNVPRSPQGRPVYVQPDRRRTAGPLPRATPRRSSPRIRRSAARRIFTPTSSGRQPPSAAIPTTSRCCPASARSSARQKPRPGASRRR